MRKQATDPGNFPQFGGRVDVSVAPAERANGSGIEVHEEECGTVTAQHVYKMRCDCGRSWFELELPQFVKCPACHRLGLVSH